MDVTTALTEKSKERTIYIKITRYIKYKKMKKNGTRQLIEEMRSMLDSSSHRRLTLEGLVYGEDGEEMMSDGQTQPVDGPMGGDEEMQAPIQGQEQAAAPSEANPLDEDPKITQLITNIRVQTLQGLTALAENPESSQYELLKKIFLMIDKAVEDKVEEESGQAR